MAAGTGTPVHFDVIYPERLSRWHLLLKSFLGIFYVGIPHGIILFFYALLTLLVIPVAFIAILITGRYPNGLFRFIVGYYRWHAQVEAYWSYYMTDEYPPFSTKPEYSPVSFEVEYPERLSRRHALLKFFLGWLYVGIPHGIILFFYAIAVLVVVFITWWSVLILQRYPQSFFNFSLGYLRWSARVNVYTSLLRDEYPPFNGRP